MGVGGECGECGGASGAKGDSMEGEDLDEGFGAGSLAEAQPLKLEWGAKDAICSRAHPFPLS